MKNELPLITVGMPVYNGACWVKASIASILVQSLTDFELIICDNASTDDTDNICHELAELDPRIRYYRHEKNLGPVANYNTLVKLARGSFFKWASCNDYCAPDFLELCSSVLKERGDVVLCCPETRIFENELSDAQDYEDANLEQTNTIDRYINYRTTIKLNNVFNGLIRIDALKKTALLGNFISSDINLIAELTLHGKFVQPKTPLFYRRISPDATTMFHNKEEIRDFFYPNRDFETHFPSWRRQLEYLAGIKRAPLSWKEKNRLYRYALRAAFWERQSLIAELIRKFKGKNKR